MEKQALLEKVGARHAGAIVGIIVDRPAKLRANFKTENIRKRSQYALQLAAYGNRAPVKQAVAAGDRSAPSLPAWVASVEKAANGLTFWKHANGTEYLALPVFGEKVKSVWTENGVEVETAAIADKLLASETAPRPSKADTEAEGQAMFNAIKLENILEVK